MIFILFIYFYKQVPGMLEYESIPGVVSTLRRFKSEQKKSEDIITVKDITNKA